MTDRRAIERMETIIDRIAEQGANDPNPNKLAGHLKLLDELALNALEALRSYGTRLDNLERLLMPSTAVSEDSGFNPDECVHGFHMEEDCPHCEYELRDDSLDVVATPPTFTSTTGIQENK